MTLRTRYDAVVVGSGHNGLVAAAYLARAGQSVLVLERNDWLGGATASQRVFPDYEAYLSRYSYLVSLLPPVIVDELGLSFLLFTHNLKNGSTVIFPGDEDRYCNAVLARHIGELAGVGERGL